MTYSSHKTHFFGSESPHHCHTTVVAQMSRCAITIVSSTPQTRYHDTRAAEGNTQIDIYFTPTESGVN